MEQNPYESPRTLTSSSTPGPRRGRRALGALLIGLSVLAALPGLFAFSRLMGLAPAHGETPGHSFLATVYHGILAALVYKGGSHLREER